MNRRQFIRAVASTAVVASFPLTGIRVDIARDIKWIARTRDYGGWGLAGKYVDADGHEYGNAMMFSCRQDQVSKDMIARAKAVIIENLERERAKRHAA